jgi:outer membrane protein assembly factor BamB
MKSPFISTLIVAAVTASAAAGEWASFRGPNGDGISTAKNVPVEWGPNKNIKWKAPLPDRGNGSPIVSRDRVFVTCATDAGKKRHLFAFDRQTGKELWVKTVEAAPEPMIHSTNDHSPSTPAADGKRVVVWHGSAGLYCYDYDGKELWSKDLGTFRHIWGFASSPVFYGETILLNCGPGERTFVTALDAASGETIWKTDEPGGDGGEGGTGQSRGKYVGSWSTPMVVKINGEDQIIVSMPTRVVAYEPKSGSVIWTCSGLGNLPKGELVYTSPIIGDGYGVAMGGFNGPAIGFKLGGSGDMTATNQLWRESQGIPQRIGSGVMVEGVVYMANAGPGTVQCIDPATGKDLWRDRLPGGDHWGSIVFADGRLYVTNQQGTTHVFKPNRERLELITSNRLGEPSNSTPAVVDGSIFIRTFKNLYCIEQQTIAAK